LYELISGEAPLLSSNVLLGDGEDRLKSYFLWTSLMMLLWMPEVGPPIKNYRCPWIWELWCVDWIF